MEHPIAPPPELVEQWRTQPEFANPGMTPVVSMTEFRLQEIATQAARWGADKELEACCKWIADNSLHHADSDLLKDLRAARRPKPPSLKEQALEALDEERGDMSVVNYNTIRSVLESLPDPQD